MPSNADVKFPAEALTPREVEVLTLTAQGKTSFEIARSFKVSHETIRTHIKNVCRKLGASNKTHAVMLAITFDLISPKRGIVQLSPSPVKH